jgi:multidrug efflux pump subunit AcrA (membrane-fusion protein)
MAQNKTKQYGLVALIFAVLAAVWLVKHSHQLRAEKKVNSQGITVSAVIAEESSVVRTMTFSGPVVGRDEVPVYSDLEQGRIDKILVDAGQRVKAGAVLATVDSARLKIQKAQQQANKEKVAAGIRQQETALEEAQAQYEQAKSEHQRGEITAQTGLISKEALEQKNTAEQLAKTRVEAAKSALGMAKAELKVSLAQVNESDLRLNQAVIRSSISGLVVERNARTGMLLVQNSEPLFMILRDDDLEVELEVSADDAPRLKLGMPVNIELTGQVTPSAINPPLPNSDHLDAVKVRVEKWMQAWQSKDINAYLASYSVKFSPEQKLAKEAWVVQRRQRLATKNKLKISLARTNVRVDGGMATVEFVQHYSANGNEDVSNKRLTLAREGNNWLIVREQLVGNLDALRAERASAALPSANSQSGSYVGKVSRAATRINRQNQIAKVRVRFNQTPNLILGQFARVSAKVASSSGIYLPDTAVRFEGSLAYVFTAREGVAKRISVKVGQHVGNKFEILEGVPVGMLVIDSAASFLRDAEPVRVETSGQYREP